VDTHSYYSRREFFQNICVQFFFVEMTMKTTMMMMMMIVVTVAQLKGISSSFPVLVMGDWG
jgi:hypothetical protein